MLACCSPADTNQEESLNTIRFAERASCIINNVSVNKDEIPSTGGNNKYKYKGRSYKIHIGNKGGKYILTGKDKKKVYINK